MFMLFKFLKNLKITYAAWSFLFLLSFFIFLRCHFQRICPFFFHRRELRFIFLEISGLFIKITKSFDEILLRAYPSRPVALQVIIPHAKCSIAI